MLWAGPVAAGLRLLFVAAGVGGLVEAVAADLETGLEAIPFGWGRLGFWGRGYLVLGLEALAEQQRVQPIPVK